MNEENEVDGEGKGELEELRDSLFPWLSDNKDERMPATFDELGHLILSWGDEDAAEEEEEEEEREEEKAGSFEVTGDDVEGEEESAMDEITVKAKNPDTSHLMFLLSKVTNTEH